MADTTITSANSVFVLTVPGLFPAPIQLQGYSSDRAFITDAIDVAEVQMGVDGRMTAGYTPMPTVQTITLQADSPSRFIFTTILSSIKTAREIFYFNGTISLPATGEAYTLTKGVLTNAKQIADAQKVLQPQDFIITWASVDPTLL